MQPPDGGGGHGEEDRKERQYNEHRAVGDRCEEQATEIDEEPEQEEPPVLAPRRAAVEVEVLVETGRNRLAERHGGAAGRSTRGRETRSRTPRARGRPLLPSCCETGAKHHRCALARARSRAPCRRPGVGSKSARSSGCGS